MMECERSITDEMFDAVREGNIEMVTKIIEKYGLCYSSFWEGGYYLLEDALIRRHLEVAKLLITRGCAVNKDEWSIINLCILNMDIEILEMALKRGANIDNHIPLKDVVNLTAIGFKQVIELLLEYGADINAEYYRGTLLHQAVDIGWLESIEFLLNRGANINCVTTTCSTFQKGYTPLHFAASNFCYMYDERALNTYAIYDNANAQESQEMQEKEYEKRASQRRRIDIIELLLNAGADINCTSNDKSTPLLIAIKNKNEILVKLLLQRGAKIESQEIVPNTALIEAVKRNHLGIVKQILQCGPDINNQYNKCCFRIAIMNRSTKDIVESLLDYGFSVYPEDANVNDAELLQKSVQYGHLRVIEDLLEYGVNVNMLCSNGLTPLHTAAQYKQKEAVELLIKYGANINTEAFMGQTPILTALRYENLEIVYIFLNLKASIENQPDLLGLAAKACNKKIIQTLLQRKLNVNSSDWNGRTALHHTALFTYAKVHTDSNRSIIANLLITKSANVNVQDVEGKTALHYACYNNYPKLTKTLLYFDADINIIDWNSFTPLQTIWRGFFKNDYYLYNPEDSSTNKVLDILLCHVFKMKMANLFLNERNLKVMKECGTMTEGRQKIARIKLSEKYNYFENECKLEIARMKSKTFENSRISLYEILVNDTKILTKYMNNENIVQELKSNNYKSEFPIYAKMIESNFLKGMYRKKILDEAKYNFHFVFNPFNDECVNKILDLLCISDLINLKDAFSLPNCL